MALASQYADTVHETPEFIKFYNSIDPKVYDDMVAVIEFTDEQQALAKLVYEPTEKEGLAVPIDSAVLDVACGTGAIGRILHAQGYNNIVGADATSNFVKVSRETGFYKEVFEHWFGTGVHNFPE